MTPPLYAHMPQPFFEATPLGAAPRPPVKTGFVAYGGVMMVLC